MGIAGRADEATRKATMNKHAQAMGRLNKGRPKKKSEAADNARRRNWAIARARKAAKRAAEKGESVTPATPEPENSECFFTLQECDYGSVIGKCQNNDCLLCRVKRAIDHIKQKPENGG